MNFLEKYTALFPAFKFLYLAIHTSIKRISSNFDDTPASLTPSELKSRVSFLFVLLVEIILFFFYSRVFADCEDSKLLQLCYQHTFFLLIYSALRYIQDVVPNFSKSEEKASSQPTIKLPNFENETNSSYAFIPLKSSSNTISSFPYGYGSRMIVLLFFCMYAYSFFFSLLVSFDGLKAVITLFGHDSKKDSKVYNVEIDYFWKLCWILIPTIILHTWGSSNMSSFASSANSSKDAKKPTGLLGLLAFLFPRAFGSNSRIMKQRASGESFRDVIFTLISNYFFKGNETQKRMKSSISDTNSSAISGTSSSMNQPSIENEAFNKMQQKIKNDQLKFDFTLYILPFLVTLLSGCVMSAILRNSSSETRIIIDFMSVVGVSVMICSAITPKIKECGLILLQTVPNEMKSVISKKLREANSIEGILELSEFHCWAHTFGNKNLVATAKFRIAKDADEFSVTQKIKTLFTPHIYDFSVQIVKETL